MEIRNIYQIILNKISFITWSDFSFFPDVKIELYDLWYQIANTARNLDMIIDGREEQFRWEDDKFVIR
jgi:hypothetical protein